MINIGAIFPQIEIGTDPGAIREYVQAVEGPGYRHLLIYDHVLGASIAHRPNWRGAYTSDTPFTNHSCCLAMSRRSPSSLNLSRG